MLNFCSTFDIRNSPFKNPQSQIRNSALRLLSSVLCLLSSALRLPRRSHLGEAGCPPCLFCPNSCCWQGVIMQNKANFQKTKMNLTPCSEGTYAKNTPSDYPKNEPNSNRRSLRDSYLELQTGESKTPTGLLLGISNRGPICG